MPLVACNECKREVSTKAATCPGCGAPVDLATIAKQAKEPGTPYTEVPEVKKYNYLILIGGLLFSSICGLGVLLFLVSGVATILGIFGLFGLFSLIAWTMNSWVTTTPARYEGNCPHCSHLQWIAKGTKRGICPQCSKAYLPFNGMFVPVD